MGLNYSSTNGLRSQKGTFGLKMAYWVLKYARVVQRVLESCQSEMKLTNRWKLFGLQKALIVVLSFFCPKISPAFSGFAEKKSGQGLNCVWVSEGHQLLGLFQPFVKTQKERNVVLLRRHVECERAFGPRANRTSKVQRMESSGF